MDSDEGAEAAEATNNNAQFGGASTRGWSASGAVAAIIVKCAAGSGGLWVEICGGKKWLPTVLELPDSPF